jgi:cellulose synthase operon protein YhjQ
VPLWLAKGYRPDDGAEQVNGVAAAEQEVANGDGGETIAAAAEVEPEARAEDEEEHVTMGRALEMVRDRAAVGRGRLDQDTEDEEGGPAWLSGSQMRTRTRVTQAISQTHGGETLQGSRELVAARWFALKGVFEHAGPELPAMQPTRTSDARTPVVAVFSLAGGVGKTSLVATLGRALSSQGERVVLTDTTSQVLLPFYFGARELRPGLLRAFSPPEGSTDEPISLVSYELEGRGEDAAQQEALAEEIVRNSVGHHRVLMDISSGSSWLIRRMAGLQPTVLVPMAPDMNSVISLQAVERVFRGMVDEDGRQLLPFYVLNQFDASLPLHLDVREVFRRQLGDRLARFAIRRSPAVSEALAEGMTVVDYAPDAPVSQDYRDVASWLRSVSPPATAGLGASDGASR